MYSKKQIQKISRKNKKLSEFQVKKLLEKNFRKFEIKLQNFWDFDSWNSEH